MSRFVLLDEIGGSVRMTVEPEPTVVENEPMLERPTLERR